MNYYLPHRPGGTSLLVQTHASGAAVTVGDTTGFLLVNPGTLLSDLTITLPTAAYPKGAELIIKFGETIVYPDQVVTALNVVAPAGTALSGSGLTPTEAIAGDTLRYALRGTVWNRLD